MPLSGEAAAFGAVGPGAKAYFGYVNSKGGVNGRTIEYRFYDDAYNPAQTVQQTRRLVGQEADNDPSTRSARVEPRDHRLAGRCRSCLPATARRRSGAGRRATRGRSASYRATAARGPFSGGTSSRRRPRRRSRCCSRSVRARTGPRRAPGLSGAIARKGLRIVASQPYETTATDVTSRIARLKASGADTLMLFATPKFLIQAIVATQKLGWRPRLYLASVSIEPTIMAIARANAPQLTRGARAIAFVKNPNDPVWRKGRPSPSTGRS